MSNIKFREVCYKRSLRIGPCLRCGLHFTWLAFITEVRVTMLPFELQFIFEANGP